MSLSQHKNNTDEQEEPRPPVLVYSTSPPIHLLKKSSARPASLRRTWRRTLAAATSSKCDKNQDCSSATTTDETSCADARNEDDGLSSGCLTKLDTHASTTTTSSSSIDGVFEERAEDSAVPSVEDETRDDKTSSVDSSRISPDEQGILHHSKEELTSAVDKRLNVYDSSILPNNNADYESSRFHRQEMDTKSSSNEDCLISVERSSVAVFPAIEEEMGDHARRAFKDDPCSPLLVSSDSTSNGPPVTCEEMVHDNEISVDIPSVSSLHDDSSCIHPPIDKETSKDKMLEESSAIPKVSCRSSEGVHDDTVSVEIHLISPEQNVCNTPSIEGATNNDETRLHDPLTQPAPIIPHDENEEEKPSRNGTKAVCSKKLRNLRAHKTEVETQLRNMMTGAAASLPSPPSSHESTLSSHSNSRVSQISSSSASHPGRRLRELIEPEVYEYMREELVKAYQTIAIQTKQLVAEKNRDAVPLAEESIIMQTGGDGATLLIADLRKQIDCLSRENATQELALQHRLTNDAIEYKKTIDHWKRETICWKDRFDSAWADHESQIRLLAVERDDWKQRAIDLETFKSGTGDAMLGLFRAKERIHHLEEHLENTVEPPFVFLPIPKPASKTLSPDATSKTTLDADTSLALPAASASPNQSHDQHQQASFVKDAMNRNTLKEARGTRSRFASWGKS